MTSIYSLTLSYEKGKMKSKITGKGSGMTGSNNATIRRIVNIINIGLVVMSVFAIVKTLFIGFDIDEAYAVAQSYRLATGDKMFLHMWEPHQMSAFGSAVFILPFLWVTGGNTVGIVLYLRIVGTILHLALGCWLYKAARTRFGHTCSLLLVLAHVNFLPKWVALPEFELMQYWGVLIAFLSLLTYVQTHRYQYMWFAGSGLFLTLMTYPTMILLYPVYLVGICALSDKNPKERFRACIHFTAAPALLGLLFLIYLRSYMTFSEFSNYLSMIFMDKSHSVSVAFRFSEYGKELGQLLLDLATCLPFALVLTGITIGITRLIKKHNAANYWFLFLLYVLVVLLFRHVWGSLLSDENQFYLYFRYVFIVVIGLRACALIKDQWEPYLYLAILPGVVGVLASALLTNMSLEISFARIYIGVIGTLFILFELVTNHWKEETLIKAVSYGTLAFFLCGLLVSKLVLVRVTGCIPVTVRMPLGQITEGPAKGISVHKDLAAQINENVPVIVEYVGNDDTLLYFGCENLYYLVTDATIATPSVQGTTVFDEVFLEYYKMHSDRMPNVVIVDKNFEKNPDYRYQYENHIVLDWIEEEFRDAECIETNNLMIYRK